MRAITLCCFVLLLGGLLPRPAFGDAGLPEAERAFRAAGASLRTARLAAWVALPRPLGPERTVAVARTLAQEYGLPAPRETAGASFTRLVSSAAQGHLSVQSVRLGKTGQTVASIWRSLSRRPRDTDVMDLTKALMDLGPPRVETVLQGEIPKTPRSAWPAILRRIEGATGLAVKTEATGGAVWSVTGETPEGGPTVLLAGHRVNLQFSLSYDRATGATLVKVGAPLATTAY